MKKEITVTLTPEGIDKAIRDVTTFTSWFRTKCQHLRKEVAERIAWSAEEGFRTARGNDVIIGYWVPAPVFVDVTHGDKISVVIADGPDAVFIEFGAGVYHNGMLFASPHPWGDEFGYAIGLYKKPYSKGVRNAWNFPGGVTRGTPADMPMYRGLNEALHEMDDIIRKVFG